MSGSKLKKQFQRLPHQASVIGSSILAAGVVHGDASSDSEQLVLFPIGSYQLNPDGTATINYGPDTAIITPGQFTVANNVLYVSQAAIPPSILAQLNAVAPNGGSNTTVVGVSGFGVLAGLIASSSPAASSQTPAQPAPAQPSNPDPVVVYDRDTGATGSIAPAFSTGAQSFAVALGSTLPPSLSLDPNTGAVTGTATLANPFVAESTDVDLTAVTASGATETATVTFGVSLNVNAADLAASSSATMQGGSQDDNIALGDLIAASSAIVSIVTDAGADRVELGDSAGLGYGEVSINTGDDDDTVVIGNAAASSSGSVSIAVGAGDDSVTIGDDAGVFYGEVTVSLGDGENSLNIGDNAGFSSGTVSVLAASGNDTISVGDRAAAGTSSGSYNGVVSIDMGEGTNDLTLGEYAGAYGGSVTVTGGSGTDRVTVGGYGAGYSGNLSLQLEGGDDQVTIGYGAARFAGAMSVDLGSGDNSLTMGDAVAWDSTVSILASSGNDSVTLGATGVPADNFIAHDGTLTVDLGHGDNDIDIIGDAAAYGGSITVAVGDGNDDVSFNGNVASIGGNVNINLGHGNNSLNINDNAAGNAGNLSITAGTGVDSITFAGDVGAIDPTSGSPVNGTLNIDLGNDNAADSISFQGDVFGTTIENLSTGDTISFARAVSIVSGNGTNTVTLTGSDIELTLRDTGTITLSPTSAGTMFTVS